MTERTGPRLHGLGVASAIEYRLGATRISVGSDGENDLIVAKPTVSRRHAILRRRFGRYTLIDLESTNGTFVNGRRVDRPIPIRPGDEIRFGAARFAVVDGASVSGGQRRRSSSKAIGAAGIALFAIAGFIATRYALSRGNLEAPANRSSRSSAVAAEKPLNPIHPAVASAAEGPEGASSDADSAAPKWLRRLNEFRAMAKLPPLRSDPAMSEGDRKHAVYVVNNYAATLANGGSLGADVHSEDSAKQWYTPDGAEAARTSDIAMRAGTPGRPVPDPQDWAIEGWMVVPFHRLFILSPLLHRVGFGDDCENGICVAMLNVIKGADPLPRIGTPLEHPILFPPDASTIPASMRQLETEWPNPVSGCDGYAFPTGIPATVQLGPMVDAQLNSFSIARADGAQLEACGFDANSYRNPSADDRARVVGDLRGEGAIVIVPKEPMEAGGRYNVVATVNGRDYEWSFTIAP